MKNDIDYTLRMLSIHYCSYIASTGHLAFISFAVQLLLQQEYSFSKEEFLLGFSKSLGPWLQTSVYRKDETAGHTDIRMEIQKTY